MIERHHLFAALACTAAAPPALAADVVDIQWDAVGRFVHQAPVAPGRLVEVCGALPAGATVAWRFTASAPLDFNIHYHEGKSVHYPVRQAHQAQADGELVSATAQDYCWMWTNRGVRESTLQLRAQRR